MDRRSLWEILSLPYVLSIRYLLARRKEAFISLITLISVVGIAIGVMVLTVVMSIMTGFETELREKIVGTDAHITIRALSGYLNNWEKVKETVNTVPDVKAADPFVYYQGLIRANGSASGLLLRGITSDSYAAKLLSTSMGKGQNISNLFRKQKYQTPLNGKKRDALLPSIIIGAELARNLNLTNGSVVTIISPNTTMSPFGLIPRFRRFVVVGIYSTGLVEYESTLAYISLKEGQEFFRIGNRVSGIEVRIKDIEQAPLVAEKIRDKLSTLSNTFIVTDWTVTNKPLWDAIKLEKKVYFIVLLLIIVMASFSIVSALVMLVLEKKKDIAILKTIGFTGKQMASVFVVQGGIIGMLGSLLGVVLGIAMCIALKEYGFPLDERIFQMSTVPVEMRISNFVVVAISAFIISLCATIYPAIKAAKLKPAEVLRYE